MLRLPLYTAALTAVLACFTTAARANDGSKEIIESIVGKSPAVQPAAPGDAVKEVFLPGATLELAQSVTLNVSGRDTTFDGGLTLNGARGEVAFPTAGGFSVFCEAGVQFVNATASYGFRDRRWVLEKGTRLSIQKTRASFYSQKDGIRISPGFVSISAWDDEDNAYFFSCTCTKPAAPLAPVRGDSAAADLVRRMRLAGAHLRDASKYVGASNLKPLFTLVAGAADESEVSASLQSREATVRRKIKDKKMREVHGLFPVDAKRWPDLHASAPGVVFWSDRWDSPLRLYRTSGGRIWVMDFMTGKKVPFADKGGVRQAREYFASIGNPVTADFHSRLPEIRLSYEYEKGYYRSNDLRWPNLFNKDGKAYYLDQAGNLQRVFRRADGKIGYGASGVVHPQVTKEVGEWLEESPSREDWLK